MTKPISHQEHKKSKWHSRVPIERCPITALLIINSLLHCGFFCFCYERRLLGYLWTHRLSIYTYISFSIKKWWLFDIWVMDRKDEMLLMGYSMDIHPHFPFFEVLPFDYALLLLIMPLIILLHNEATQGFFLPTQVRRYVSTTTHAHTSKHVTYS